MSDKLRATEKVVKEVLIDLMAEKSNVYRYSRVINERSARFFIECSWIRTISTGNIEENQSLR
jgi:hypothetical protein